jgi:hypothetical protein
MDTMEPNVGDPAEDSVYQTLVNAVGNSVLQMANILHTHKLVRYRLYGLSCSLF